MNVIKLLYILYFAGVALAVWPLMEYLAISVRSRFAVHRNLSRLTDDRRLKRQSPAERHIQLLVEGAEAQSLFASPGHFLVFSMVCGCGAAGILSLAGASSMAMPCGIFAAAMPYCILNARLYNRRVERSREGDILVQEILNNYKIYGCNMKEAIEVTAATIEDAPGGRRLLLNLAKGFHTAVTREEVEDLLSVFRFSIDTTWGSVLASNIFFSYMYGVRVDTALEDLQACIAKSRQVVEHGKRENNEARLMLKYLAPVTFFLSAAGACRYFGFTPGKFIRYQLGTPLGLKWFLIIVMLYGAGILINVFFSREKMDI
ncbi:MAG: hypothetical protein ACI4LA_10240 [Emergencia sp.]